MFTTCDPYTHPSLSNQHFLANHFCCDDPFAKPQKSLCREGFLFLPCNN
jgi:hypothetical protein